MHKPNIGPLWNDPDCAQKLEEYERNRYCVDCGKSYRVSIRAHT